jgi:hypothetical protein
MFDAGDSTAITLPPGTAADHVILAGTRFPASDGKAQVKLPDQPGVYELTTPNAPARFLAVNPPPRESELTYTANPEAPVVWTVQKSYDQSAAARASIMRLSRTEILRQHWWWWLALAVVAALAVEMLWSSVRKAQV